ncbi:MAG: hypothetical protein R3B60_01435 [Candidatus Paceibacterota bacterium]
MKKQLLYIHGGDSFSNYEDFLNDLRSKTIRNLPSDNNEELKKIWTTSLEEDLGEDFEVFRPSMPNKQNAKYEEWKIWFERHFEFLHDEVVLLGWSLGGMFLAKYLTENDFPIKIKSVYLLGAPSGDIEPDETGNDCGDFCFSNNSLSFLVKKAKKINIWHSEDDFVVPYTEFLKYRQFLDEKTVNFVSFKDKNHFLLTEFPELITSIKADFL